MIALGCSWAPWDWGDCVSQVLGKAFRFVFGSLFSVLADAFKQVVIQAVEAVMKGVGTLWVDIKTPNIADANGQAIGAASFAQTHTYFILVTAATISVIVAGIRMALSQRGEPLRDVLKSLLIMVVVSGSGLAFASALIKAADSFSAWIIDQAVGTNGGFSTRIATALTEPLKGNGVPVVMVILIGILMVITSLMQLGLMIVRYGMLVLLVGVLPLTAAATNTEVGMAWFKRAVSWLAAFILYKPLAALIYATAIRLIGTPAVAPDANLKVVTGVTMMLMAVVALPALLRFVSPKT
jgi:type IV secretory pathway TrbD component